MVAFIVFIIFFSIFLGYRTKINIGLIAMAFSYIIGSFFMDLSPKNIINFWPISIFFVIFSVSLFYSFASVNGTLEKIATILINKFQSFPYFLPYAIFFISALIAAMGAGFYSVLALMAPLTFIISQKTGLDRIGGAMAINYGALGGANFPTSQSGIIFRGIMEKLDISSETSFYFSFLIFIATIILPIFVISYFVIKAKSKMFNIFLIENVSPFNSKQKITLLLVLLMMVIVLIIPLLHLIFSSNLLINMINNKLDIGFISIIFATIALLLKLGDEKEVLLQVPWGTLIMICGVGMLIAVALKAGVIDTLATFIGTNVSHFLIPLLLMIIAAIMSLFSSTLGVVTPTLFPLVPVLSEISQYNQVTLFICIVLGAQSSAISPFSSGGSLILGSATKENRDKLFKDLIFKAIPIGFISALCMVILIIGLLK